MELQLNLQLAPVFLQRQEEPPKLYPCKYCNKVYDNPRALGGHQTAHKDVRMQAGNLIPAPTCSSGVVTDGPPAPQGMRPQKRYRCDVCDKTFDRHQALGGHMTLHRDKPNQAAAGGDGSESLGSCSPTSVAGSSLGAENVGEPAQKRVKLYHCRMCNEKYTCPQALGGHQTIHRDERKQAVQAKLSDAVIFVDYFEREKAMALATEGDAAARSSEFDEGDKHEELDLTLRL